MKAEGYRGFVRGGKGLTFRDLSNMEKKKMSKRTFTVAYFVRALLQGLLGLYQTIHYGELVGKVVAMIFEKKSDFHFPFCHKLSGSVTQCY